MFPKSFLSFVDRYYLDIPRIEASLLRGMKPGKILQRELLLSFTSLKDNKPYLDTLTQVGLASMKADEYAGEVLFAYSYEKILEVYNDANCPSCMMGEGKAEIAAAFYAANGFVVAYRHDGEKVTARTVTFGKNCTEFYGPEALKLSTGLQELEYTPAEGSLLPFWSSFEVPYINGKFYIPYLDCATGCFIPYAGRHDTTKSRWECLYVPYSIEYGELINEEDEPEFIKLKDYIGHGDYLDQFIVGMPHGEPCNPKDALHHLNKLFNPEMVRMWDLKLINGNMFWIHHHREDSGSWECNTVFMDDYGNTVDRPYGGQYGDIHTEISLGDLGYF